MPLINVVHGDKLPPAPFNLRVPALKIPWWASVAWWTLRTLFTITVFLLRHYRITLPLFVVGYALNEWGPWWTGGTAALLAAGLGVWWWKRQGSFLRFVGYPALAGWRRAWIYKRGWLAATANTGLTAGINGATYVPKIVKVRTTAVGDEVTVRMLAGQQPSDWVDNANRFAHTFGARSARVSSGRRSGLIVLRFRRADPVLSLVSPMPVPLVPNLAALPVAIRDTGEVWSLKLAGAHVLIAGATDAGKGSAMWSIISALAGGVRSGLVQLWAFDPKGGMELAAGEPMFARFSYDDPSAMAGDLEDAVKVLRRRADALRGKSRQHVATVGDPTIVILIDEIAALTGYISSDKKLRDRIKDALSLLLSQGRAVGVHVIAAIQDPRKETLPLRELFPVRIALRLTEPGQVDLVLNDGARDRGATCDEIPLDMPGVGYVRLSGRPDPIRLRFSYHNDAQLKELVATHTPDLTVEA